MKHLQTTLLIAGLFAFGAASATPLTADDIFEAIDGEYETTTLANEGMDSVRVNFDLSIEDSNTEGFWKNGNEGLLDDTYY